MPQLRQVSTLILLGIIVLLNIADCWLTLYWIDQEAAVEANPLMAAIVHIPWLFCTVKMSMILLGSAILYFYREKRLTIISIILTIIFYTFIVMHNCRFFV